MYQLGKQVSLTLSVGYFGRQGVVLWVGSRGGEPGRSRGPQSWPSQGRTGPFTAQNGEV